MNTNTSTSSQINVPAISRSNQYIGLGNKYIIELTLRIKLQTSIIPTKEQNYFIPSCLNLGLPVIILKHISIKCVLGISSLVCVSLSLKPLGKSLINDSG